KMLYLGRLLQLPGWNSLETVRLIHSVFEIAGIGLFVTLVVCEILAHRQKKHIFHVLGLWAFALAVLAEALAVPFSHRKDALYEAQEVSRAKAAEERLRSVSAIYEERIAHLDNRVRSNQEMLGSTSRVLSTMQAEAAWRR